MTLVYLPWQPWATKYNIKMILKARVHWQRLCLKMWGDTTQIKVPICVVTPKVAKASSVVSLCCHYRVKTSPMETRLN